ncbi:hypothetical protein SKAU_G00365520 [Synaphobranchus kaupii]|uniref:Uncharacterized protein n=1 Tax=Synaphobranchus kaupii TaxID=118154 RepID=A0A9Q1EF29_SYNKA|nr:hypothetical protein SKAU_G00365520 [Synaphobranchus kaupii]
MREENRGTVSFFKEGPGAGRWSPAELGLGSDAREAAKKGRAQRFPYQSACVCFQSWLFSLISPFPGHEWMSEKRQGTLGPHDLTDGDRRG